MKPRLTAGERKDTKQQVRMHRKSERQRAKQALRRGCDPPAASHPFYGFTRAKK